MTTRLTISSLAAPITIKANTTFSAPLAANAAGPFVIALGTTTKGALATVNLKSIGDVAAAKTTLILPGASTDYIFKTASGAVTISSSTINPTTKKVTTTVIASLDLTKVAVDTPLVKFTDLTAKFHPTSTKAHTLTPSELLTIASPTFALDNDAGISKTDGVTNDGALNLSAHTSGGVISFSVDGGKTYTTGALPEGVYAAGAIKVIETSTNGSVSKASTNAVAITVDKTAPAAATKIALDTDTAVATDNITSDGTINITGTLEAKAHWEFSVNGGTTFTAVAADATSFVVPASATAYAANQIQVKQVDLAGNSSAVTKLETALTVDETATVPVIALTKDNGISLTDGITNVATVTVSGLEVGAVWQYSINGADFVNGTGTTFTLPEGETYDAGQINVRQIDVAGNESDADGKFGTNSIDWTINNPITVSVSAPPSSLEGSNATFTVSLSEILTTEVSVKLSLDGVNGTTAVDYSATGSVVGASVSNNVLTFAPGQTTAVLTFPIATDSLLESGEGLALTLALVSGLDVGVKTASATTQIADPTSTANLSATITAVTATAGVDTFNIASGTYTGTIGNFASGDKLSFFSGASLTVMPDANQADGIQQISAADPTTGATTTITFSGLTAAQDAGVFNVDSFNTLFGAGTISYAAAVIPTTTASLSATVLTGAGTAGVDTFNIASGTYAATISNFANGDKLSFFTGASLTVLPDSNQTDGIQQISAADPATGATATITLTGLTSVQDAGVFNVSSFNTIFGAGTIG